MMAMYKPKKIILYFSLLFLIGICAVSIYLYISLDAQEPTTKTEFIEVVN